MKACALLGGPKSAWPADLRQQLQAAQAAGTLLIGVDRGSLLLLELALAPAWAARRATVKMVPSTGFMTAL